MKFFYFLIAIGLFSSIFANEVAFVKKLRGTAYVTREGKDVALALGVKLLEKDIIFTNAKSSLCLIFKDQTRISIGPESEFSIEKGDFTPKKESIVTNLSKGSVECITGLISKINPAAFKIKAKTATMGIRGTRFIINVD